MAELIAPSIRNNAFDFRITPTQGDCGICFWIDNQDYFDNLRLIPFVKRPTFATDEMGIEDTIAQQLVRVQSAILNAGLYNAVGQPALVIGATGNQLTLTFTVPIALRDEFSFTFTSSAPINYYVVTDTVSTTGDFVAIIEMYQLPTFNQYIVLNPPPKDIGLNLNHVWNFEGTERLMAKQRIPALFSPDIDNKRLDPVIYSNVAPVLDNYVHTPAPKFLNFATEYAVAYQEPQMTKEIQTYVSYSFTGQEARTDQYRVGAGNSIIFYNSDYYRIHNGKCANVEGNRIGWNAYAHDTVGTSNFLGVHGNFEEICSGDVVIRYMDLPAGDAVPLTVNFNVNSFANTQVALTYENGFREGMHYFNFTTALDGSYAPTLNADTVAISILDIGGASLGQFNTNAVTYDILDPNCDECCNGVQFLFLSSFGVFESFRMRPQPKENFEGKAVDITYDATCIPAGTNAFSSITRHKNRGIQSEEVYFFNTFKKPITDHNVLLFREFISSTQVYQVNGYGDLEPVILKTGNYVINRAERFFEFEVSLKYANKRIYTDNVI